MTTDLRIVKRRAQVCDVVRSKQSGILWLVEEVRYTYPWRNSGPIDWYGVVKVENQGIPNSFSPAEVETVHIVDARRLLDAAAQTPKEA